jgi:methionyl-tRNA formyltransferase
VVQTILLLTRREEYPFLAEWLRGPAPGVAVVWTPDLPALNAIDESTFANARLISFLNGVIVPRQILARLGCGAYNFHPGPPRYPGSAPATFAILDDAAAFGVTLHEMHERVDTGPIVDFALFSVPPEITLNALEQLTYIALIKLFQKFAADLACRAAPLPFLKTSWSGQRSTRRAYAELCEIPPDISPADLARRLRALGVDTGAARPWLNLHGHRFAFEPHAGAVGPRAKP